MKQTEIGLIPDDWKVKDFKLLTSRITVGIANSATYAYSDHGIIMFRNQNIKENFLDIDDIVYIKEDFAVRYVNKKLKANDLLIARTGYPGTTCVVPDKFSGTQTFTTLIATLKNTLLDSNYCAYFFNSEIGKRLFSAAQIGGAQKNVNAHTLANIPVPIPPTLAEQQKIAKALSDVDSVISTLGKLITKKNNLKQATMQQLLTGKKRLPGFAKSDKFKQTEIGEIPEDWEVKELRNIGFFISGSGFPLNEQGKVNEEFPFYKVSDFNNIGNENRMSVANNYISRETASKLGCKIIPVNSIVFAKIGAAILLERKRPTTISCCIDNNMMAFVTNQNNDYLFVCYCLQQMNFSSLVTATALPSLNAKVIGKQLLKIPSKSEQLAIANVLSSMDKEIESLNKKLSKYRSLKNGMMQQLLTGKIRLV